MHLKCSLIAYLPYLLNICREFEYFISQGSVATCLRWVGYCRINFVANFIRFPAVKRFENRRRCDKVTECLKVGTFFDTQCIDALYFLQISSSGLELKCYSLNDTWWQFLAHSIIISSSFTCMFVYVRLFVNKQMTDNYDLVNSWHGTLMSKLIIILHTFVSSLSVSDVGNTVLLN